MAAFQFPDPLVQQTVVNPVTGSTYQWQDPPGKWVVTVKAREVSDLIWEGDSPPSAPGYKLWYSTDTLELYFYYTDPNGTGAWLPTSKPITMLEDLDNSLFEVKGDIIAANVAISENENRIDSIIFFGPAEPFILPDDIYTQPDGSVITESNKLNYKFWLNTTTGELLVLRVDADADKGYSYQQVSGASTLQEVCDNGNTTTTGATFGGKVIVEPGTEGSEVVTYQQLAELDQEIEDIRPSIDRGEWLYTPGNSSISSGQYIAYKLKIDGTYCNELYTACLLTAGDDSDAKAECNRKYMECGIAADNEDPDFNANWEYCDFIKLHKTDVNGRLHTFSDAEGEMYVEIFNTDGSGFGLYQIIPNGVAGGGGQAIGIYVTHVHSEGTPNGNARVKLFEMASANPADYVSKAGDTMSGELEIIREGGGTNCLYLKSTGTGTMMYAVDETKKTLFRIQGNGKVQAGADAANAFMATADNDVATKKYVDSLVVNGPARLAWRWLGINNGAATTPEDGGFYKSGNYLRFSFKTDNNIDLSDNLISDTESVNTSYGPYGTIWKYNDSNNKWQLIRQIRLDSFRWNYKGHFEFELSSGHGDSFSDLTLYSQAYYVTIGGFF